MASPCGLSTWVSLSFLTAWWLGSKSKAETHGTFMVLPQKSQYDFYHTLQVKRLTKVCPGSREDINTPPYSMEEESQSRQKISLWNGTEFCLHLWKCSLPYMTKVSTKIWISGIPDYCQFKASTLIGKRSQPKARGTAFQPRKPVEFPLKSWLQTLVLVTIKSVLNIQYVSPLFYYSLVSSVFH